MHAWIATYSNIKSLKNFTPVSAIFIANFPVISLRQSLVSGIYIAVVNVTCVVVAVKHTTVQVTRLLL
jgi:hypothetical protein